ncbi:MAG: hypothetical protein FJ303_27500 [Planctomycetes bacterium]|nr:hypothetical protein [Planctomycetota bacterium]
MIIAAGIISAAGYFAWAQHLTLRVLNFDVELPDEERRFSLSQCWRRLFGSLVLAVLGGMLAGALFFDYDPRTISRDDARFLIFYVMTMLLLLLVIMVLAVFDFWATARHTISQQKNLLREQQEILEAELEAYRQEHPDEK